MKRETMKATREVLWNDMSLSLTDIARVQGVSRQAIFIWAERYKGLKATHQRQTDRMVFSESKRLAAWAERKRLKLVKRAAWSCLHPNGYIRKYRPAWMEGPPNSAVTEHVIVYFQANGMTSMPKGMVIHHINHNPADNRIENLVMMSAIDHTTLHRNLEVMASSFGK